MRFQDVVCAFLVNVDSNDGDSSAPFRLLCAQRHSDTEHFPNLWEFPGGKVDEGETHVQALIRESREELGVDILVADGAKPCYAFHHAPKPDKRMGGTVTFRLYFYWASIANGQPEPRALASQRVSWLQPNEMNDLVFCPGDQDIINALNDGSLRP